MTHVYLSSVPSASSAPMPQVTPTTAASKLCFLCASASLRWKLACVSPPPRFSASSALTARVTPTTAASKLCFL